MTLRFVLGGALLLATLGACQPREDRPWQDAPPSTLAEDEARANLPTQLRYGMDPGTSVVVAGVLVHGGLGALVLLAAVAAWMHRRRGRVEAAFDPGAPLVDGPAVIFGTVETSEGRPAIVVRIEQEGRNIKTKNGWCHQWREVARHMDHGAFHVRRAEGGRVRVEPGERVALHDALSREEHLGALRRARVAELVAGEAVYITGNLSGVRRARGLSAYRDAGTEPVLRPPPLGRMVVSTERPGATARARMRVHAGWCIALVALLGVLEATALGGWSLLSVAGEPVVATVTATRTWRVWHKPKNSRGYWVTHYGLRAAWSDAEGRAQLFEDEVSYVLHACVRGGLCPRVPFVVLRSMPSVHMVGTEPAVTYGEGIVCSILTLMALVAYAGSVVSSRPWYLRRRVNDNGSGKIA